MPEMSEVRTLYLWMPELSGLQVPAEQNCDVQGTNKDGF